MARMSIRATYALDEATDRRIRRLAQTWNVSQAEVIRRSVRTAEEACCAMTPADVVARYAKGSLPRSESETRRIIRSLRDLRHADDRRRTAEPR